METRVSSIEYQISSSMFSHLWLWASSGAPRRLQASLWCFFFSFSTHLGQNQVSSIKYLVVWLVCCPSPFHVTFSLLLSSLSSALGPLLSLHIFPFPPVFLVFTSVVVGFFGGTTPTLGRSLAFFLFLFHPLGHNRVSSIEYRSIY